MKWLNRLTRSYLLPTSLTLVDATECDLYLKMRENLEIVRVKIITIFNTSYTKYMHNKCVQIYLFTFSKVHNPQPVIS